MMKKVLLFILFFSPIVLLSQTIYNFETEPICWDDGAGTQTSLTRVYLLTEAQSTFRKLLYTVDANFNIVTPSGGTITLGWCDCCSGGAASISPWKTSAGENTNDATVFVQRTGDVSIGVNDNTHTLRMDGDFQFRFPNSTGIFDWRTSAVNGWDKIGMLFQDVGELNAFPSIGRNTFGFAANNANIVDRTLLGSILFAGTDPDGGITTSAGITSTASGNWASNSFPSLLNFWITKDGQSFPSNVFTLQADGRVELDEYVNFNDGLPTSILWFEQTDKDIFKTIISGTPSSGDVIKVDGPGTGLEWGSNNLWGLSNSDIFYNSGNVGIGNNDPSFLLDVGNNTTSNLFRFRNLNSAFYIGQSTSDRFGYTAGTANLLMETSATLPLVLGTFSGTDLAFGTNNFTRMIVKSDGKIGIGTTSPSNELDIVGNIGLTNGDFTLNSTAGSSEIFVQEGGITRGGFGNRNSKFQLFGGGSANEHWVISANGFVSQNHLNPIAQLDILRGTDQFAIRRSSTLVTVFDCEPDGSLIIKNSQDNGSTYTGQFFIGIGDVVGGDDTDITGVFGHANSIVTLVDVTDDANTSDYTIQAVQETNGMTLFIECDNSADFVDDGCVIETVGATLIENASNYVFSSNKIVTLRYSSTKGMWRILNQ